MAAFEEKPLVEEHNEDFNDQEEASGCGCFRAFGLKWWKSHENDEGKRLLLQEKGEGWGEEWVMNKLRKMKEVSEVIAGPKWKTFIRKISGYGRSKEKKKRFQYDEQSYALNFNSGAQREDEDEDMPPSFSVRFSTAPFAAETGTGTRQTEL